MVVIVYWSHVACFFAADKVTIKSDLSAIEVLVDTVRMCLAHASPLGTTTWLR